MISCWERLVTMDEPWLYHYDPETTQQSMVWRHSGSKCLKEFRVENPLENSRLDFLGARDILLIDYLPKGQTINSEQYASLLVQLKDILKEKRGWRFTKGVILARQCPGSPGTCNPKKTGLSGLPISWSPTLFSGSGPFGLPHVPWTEKTIESSPFLFRRRGHFCRGDLVGRTIFWIFFEWLAKLEQGVISVLGFVGSMLNKSRVWSL